MPELALTPFPSFTACLHDKVVATGPMPGASVSKMQKVNGFMRDLGLVYSLIAINTYTVFCFGPNTW